VIIPGGTRSGCENKRGHFTTRSDLSRWLIDDHHELALCPVLLHVASVAVSLPNGVIPTPFKRNGDVAHVGARGGWVVGRGPRACPRRPIHWLTPHSPPRATPAPAAPTTHYCYPPPQPVPATPTPRPDAPCRGSNLPTICLKLRQPCLDRASTVSRACLSPLAALTMAAINCPCCRSMCHRLPAKAAKVSRSRRR